MCIRDSLNSDSTLYGPDYGDTGNSVVAAAGNPAAANITIGPYSALVLSQIPDMPPSLSITQTNGAVNIAWPSVYAGWNLETAPALDAGWSPVPPSQFQTNASSISITVTPSAAPAWYRLHRIVQ